MVLDAGNFQHLSCFHVFGLLSETRVGVDVNARWTNDLDLLSSLLIVGWGDEGFFSRHVARLAGRFALGVDVLHLVTQAAGLGVGVVGDHKHRALGTFSLRVFCEALVPVEHGSLI